MAPALFEPREPRPLPQQLWVVAFPSAAGPGTTCPSGCGLLSFYVQAAKAQVQLGPTPTWLSVQGVFEVAPRCCRVDLCVQDNPRQAREAALPVQVGQHHYRLMLQQQAGLLLQDTQLQVLNAPLTVDMSVAVTFIAQQIQKIPIPPLKLLVAVLAALALVALGLVVSAARHAFVNLPEPAPLSTDTLGQPIQVLPGLALTGVLPLPGVPLEDQTIALQTLRSIYWLLREVLEG